MLRRAGVDGAARPPRDLGVDPAWFSVPESIDFPTSGGRTAHALYYPPANPEAIPPPGEAPPLLVVIHGGPTAAARPMLQLGIQYWTSRGFGVGSRCSTSRCGSTATSALSGSAFASG